MIKFFESLEMNDFSTRGPDKVFRFENEEPGGDFGPLGFLVLWVYPGASRRERRCAAPLRENLRRHHETDEM